MSEITAEHIINAAPAIAEKLKSVRMPTMARALMGMFGLTSPEAAAGIVELMSNQDAEDIGEKFLAAIEKAGGRKFPPFA